MVDYEVWKPQKFSSWMGGTDNDNSFGIWNTATLAAGSQRMMFGCNDANGDANMIRNSTGTLIFRNYQGGSQLSKVEIDAVGFWLGVRRSSSDAEFYENGVSVSTTGVASAGAPDVNFFIGARNSLGSPANHSPITWVFSWFGLGVSTGEAASIYSNVLSYQTTIGR